MVITGIDDYSIDTPSAKDTYYNLQGQRLNRMQKGLNIVNGRKVFVK